MSAVVVGVIDQAVAQVVQRWGIPREFVTTDVVGRPGGEDFHRTVITLPDEDQNTLVLSDDDTDVVVLRCGRTGLVHDRIRVSTPRLPIVRAIVEALVAEATTSRDT